MEKDYAKAAASLIAAFAIPFILPIIGCKPATDTTRVSATDKDHRISRAQATAIANQLLRRISGNFDLSEPAHTQGNAWIFMVDSHGDRTVGGHFFIRVLSDGKAEVLPGA